MCKSLPVNRRTVLHVIRDEDRVGGFGIYHQFEDVEQLAGVSSAEAEHGSGFFQFYFPFLQHGVRGDGALQQFQRFGDLAQLAHLGHSVLVQLIGQVHQPVMPESMVSAILCK